jgi:hypothetical protein
MPQNIQGTFVSGSSPGPGQTSDVLVIPAGTVNGAATYSARLTLPSNPISTIDASNTARTQRSLDNGVTWANQVTYNSAQNNVAITVAPNEQWRLQLITQQAFRSMDYSLSVERSAVLPGD